MRRRAAGRGGLTQKKNQGTIVVSDLSLWVPARGFRVGWAVLPKPLAGLAARMAAASSHIYTPVPGSVQRAAVAAVRPGAFPEHRAKTRRVLAHLARFCVRELEAAGLGVPVAPRAGGCVFVEFGPVEAELVARGAIPEGATDAELCAAVFDGTGVEILPGSLFGVPSYIRLSAVVCFSNFKGDAALEALEDHELDDAFVERFMTAQFLAVRKLGAWLRGPAAREDSDAMSN